MAATGVPFYIPAVASSGTLASTFKVNGWVPTSAGAPTGTRRTFYTDAELTTPASNPATLGASGRVFYTSPILSYAFTITSADEGTTYDTIHIPAGLDGAASVNPINVATNAALTALTAGSGLVDNGVYQTLGRVSENDGGQGLWLYDSASTTTADGGFTCLAIDGGGAGRFKRLFSGPVHSKWGCVADGSTDDTTALNTFFALAGTYPLHIDAGTHRFTSALTVITANAMHVTGDGREKSVLKYYGASATPGNLMEIGNSTQRDILFMKDFTLGSNTALTTSGYALKIIRTTNVHLNIALNAGGNIFKGLRTDRCDYVWLNETQVYSKDNAVECNDGVEFNMGSAELLAVTPNTGYGVLVGGGMGGFHAENCGALFFDIGLYIATSLATNYTLTGNTNTSTTISNLSSTTDIRAGMSISGTDIPANTYVVSVNTGASTCVISNAATGSSTGVTLTVFNGNSQIFLGNSLWDSCENAAMYVDDSTVRPGGKIISMDNAWLSGTTVGSGLALVSWKGTVNMPGTKIRSNAGYGVNITDTTCDIRIGSGSDIGWNTLGGVYSPSRITINSDCVPHDNTGADWADEIIRRHDRTFTWNVTIANSGNSVIPTGAGTVTLANDTNGDIGVYDIGGGNVSMRHSLAATWVAATTSPGAAERSVGFSSTYRIYVGSAGGGKFYCTAELPRPSV